MTREGLKKIRDGIRTADRGGGRPSASASLSWPTRWTCRAGVHHARSHDPRNTLADFTRTAKLADSLDHYVNDPPKFRAHAPA